jgi:glycosyltransferase involved in cell wall biosynthesis
VLRPAVYLAACGQIPRLPGRAHRASFDKGRVVATMRIAQVAPLYESCPPQLYGGTERVVSYLTEELVKLGHDVTLYASGDSRTAARLEAGCSRALRLDPDCRDPLAHHMIMLHRLAQRADDFDIIHFHTDYYHFPLFAGQSHKALTTLHGRLDLPDLPAIMREFAGMPLVSISDSQRAPLAWANWHGTVYHGLPLDLYRAGCGDGGYLAFLGRICPEKRPDLAVEIAQGAGLPLTIAAKVDKVDRAYYKTRLKPLLKDPRIDFIGEIGEGEKGAFLGDAVALLFPVDWPEPFGLVLIEAMANGTPVIAFRRGSVPEIVEPGVTGFIVDNIEEAVAAIAPARALDRLAIRRRFEERFSVERMAKDYLSLYASLLGRGITERGYAGRAA